MKLVATLIVSFLFLTTLTHCTIYRSAERKNFESESSTFRVQNLTRTSCSNQSYKSQAVSSKLVTIFQEQQTQDSEFLWEYITTSNTSVFESDNLNGVYCVFENQ